MFSCEFHCSSYFFINAINKVVANHLMQRQQDNSHWRFPLLSMILSLLLVLFVWTSHKSHISSPPILEWIPSSGLWCLNNDNNNLSNLSSVLEPPHIVYVFIFSWIFVSMIYIFQIFDSPFAINSSSQNEGSLECNSTIFLK